MRRVSILAAMALAAPSAAFAEDNSHDFYLKGGAYFSKIDSALRIDANNGSLGTELDLEDDLGLSDRDNSAFALAGWRFSENWRVEAEFFKLSRKETKVIDRNITIGETTYPVNGSVSAGLSSAVYRLAVGYSFVRNDKLEIGGVLGAHVSDFSVFVEGNGSVNGQTGTLRRETRSQLVPLPTLGLFGRYALNDTFALVARADYFSLKISDYKGSLLDLSAGVTANITKHFGIGADFRYVDYGLRATGDKFTGYIDYTFYGPFVYVVVGF